MKTLKRIFKQPFLKKMKPASIFRNFYTENMCLISEGVLAVSEDTKEFVLTRVFIDLKKPLAVAQPYVIFIKSFHNFVILDLVSRPANLEFIIDQHDQVSVGHAIFGVGNLGVKNDQVILNRKSQNDDLAATILWSVDFATNLEPDEHGLDLVKEILAPSL